MLARLSDSQGGASLPPNSPCRQRAAQPSQRSGPRPTRRRHPPVACRNTLSERGTPPPRGSLTQCSRGAERVSSYPPRAGSWNAASVARKVASAVCSAALSLKAWLGAGGAVQKVVSCWDGSCSGSQEGWLGVVGRGARQKRFAEGSRPARGLRDGRPGSGGVSTPRFAPSSTLSRRRWRRTGRTGQGQGPPRGGRRG